METKSWERAIGKKPTHLDTLDGEYEFNGHVVDVLKETNAWHQTLCGSVFDVNGHDVHMVLAENARYWKTDGQIYAINVVAQNRETKQAWTFLVLCSWSLKETKEDIKNIKARILKVTKDEFVLSFEERKRIYSDWSEPHKQETITDNEG